MKREILKFTLLVALVGIAPLFFHEGYLLNVMVFVGIHTMLAVALNLLLGYTGQISLGHAGFFGLGAYISGILTATHGINPWLAMIAAAAMVTILAFLVGFPILKLKGHYLAMATLGLGIIIYIFFNEAVELTGGPSGLSGIPNLSIFGTIFDTDLKNYYLVWAITLLSMGLALNLVNSRIGRALRAIHGIEEIHRHGVAGVAAAHLAGVIAAYTTLPVIGLPIKSSTMDGLDSLLSIVQMPSGIPVATVAIGAADNAAILAAQILALSDAALAKRLIEFKEKMAAAVIEKDKKLQSEVNDI